MVHGPRPLSQMRIRAASCSRQVHAGCRNVSRQGAGVPRRPGLGHHRNCGCMTAAVGVTLLLLFR
jgi:hypothetical protein